jgi:hypothetical protein
MRGIAPGKVDCITQKGGCGSSLSLLVANGLTLSHHSMEPSQHIHGHKHSYRTISQRRKTLRSKTRRQKHTQSQIRHIKLPQLNLLRVQVLAPAQIIRNARGGRDSGLHSVHKEVHGYSRVIWKTTHQHEAYTSRRKTGGVTSDQSSNGPNRQGKVVHQFHVHVHVEPCRRAGEEAVGVGCDVPFAQRGDELGLEVCWVERS